MSLPYVQGRVGEVERMWRRGWRILRATPCYHVLVLSNSEVACTSENGDSSTLLTRCSALVQLWSALVSHQSTPARMATAATTYSGAFSTLALTLSNTEYTNNTNGG